MKAGATVLVLIAGAAVVLWYGNTLNSWVLGGLIGGLAALLLSIPISLTLFSYLSRRHDERLWAEAQQESMVMSRTYDYRDIPARVAKKTYEVESYRVSTEPLMGQLEEPRRQVYTQRNLPAPVSPQSLERFPSSGRLAAQNGAYPQGMRQQKDLSATREKDAPGRRTTKQIRYPGFPGYNPNSNRGQHQSAALRAARLEATQQYNDEEEVEWLLTNVSKRSTPTRSSQTLSSQNNYTAAQSSSTPSRRLRRTVDALQEEVYFLPAGNDADEDQYSQYAGPQTDSLQNVYRDTGPMRPQTGRRPHVEEQRRRNPDVVTGSIQNPMLRRAPYMYEDDPLRQELAQHISGPIVRRSSRFETVQNEEEE